jgi:hypothetical protein
MDQEKEKDMGTIKQKMSKQRVVEKFTELHKKYFVNRGFMVSTVNDEFSKQFIELHPEIKWVQTYNAHAETYIQSANISVVIFGKSFSVLLERPLYPVHRSEFEYYFGFGGHCEGYTEFRMIARFLSSFEEHSFHYEELLLQHSDNDNNDDTIDIDYIKDVFKLLVIGGYVKYWKAMNELNQWFIDNIHDDNDDDDDRDSQIRKWLLHENGLPGTINTYIFEKYETVQRDT